MKAECKIKFGVEQEHFILKNGKPPQHTDIEDLFNLLRQNGFYPICINGDGKIGTIAKETTHGTLSIKNDFCTHILEVAFPPLSNLNDFICYYEENFETIKAALFSLGMNIEYGGILHTLPNEVILYAPNQATTIRQQRLVNRYVEPKRFSEVKFFAAICATQIHVEMPTNDLYNYLPQLYAYDYLAPLFFSNSKLFNNQRAHCVRPLIYRDSFDLSYRTYGFPSFIPKSQSDYENFIKNSTGFIKDYCLIIPREDLGTIEFRSACAQNSIATILELIVLRILVTYAARYAYQEEPQNIQEQFYKVCETGLISPEILKNHLNILENVASFISHEFQGVTCILLEKLRSNIGNMMSVEKTVSS